MPPLYRLPDVSRDTFSGLSDPLSDIIKNMQFGGQQPFDPFAPLQQMQGLSQMFGQQPLWTPMQRTGASMLPPNYGNEQPAWTPRRTGATMGIIPMPEYDNWTLPKGTAGGVLDPLPTYKVGTGPTYESMNYTTPLHSRYKQGNYEGPAEFEPYIQEAARLYHVPPEVIKTIIKIESNYNPNDVNAKSGATGLMQLMKATAIDAGLDPALRKDPRQNILAATRYIRNIYDKYHYWPLVFAAYNAGPNYKSIRSGQIPNFQETRDYVRRAMSLLGWAW